MGTTARTPPSAATTATSSSETDKAPDPFLLRCSRLITVAAWVLAGIALWFSRSVLDMFGNAHESTRVAMLPSAPELAGLIVLALVVAASVVAFSNRWTRDTTERSDVRLQIALPLAALGLLVLPYLPWLPDWILPLRALAGPITGVVWFVVAGLVVMSALSMRAALRRRPRAAHGTRLLGTMVIFALTVAVAGTAGRQLRDSLAYPSGDEPHYMVMMQSLWRDHDLRIQNNYDRKDYDEYFQSPLGPDIVSAGSNGQLYPARPVGLAMLGAPVFAWRGYHGVMGMLVLLTALAAALMWRWAFAHTGSGEAATLAWAAVFLGAPVLFTSIAVYPDIPAALCVMVALGWRSSPQRAGTTTGEYIVRGFAVSALPWLSMIYVPMATALVVILGLRTRSNRKAGFALLSLFTISLVSWLAFFRIVWGHASPIAPYGAELQLGNPVVGSLGLLFDQEFGVLPYAPALIVGLVGLWQMVVARDPLTRQRGREVAIVFASLLVSAGMLAAWWGGTAPPGRPLVPALPVLGLPIAWAYQRTAASAARRSACQILTFIGVAFSIAMLFAQGGELIAQDRDGSSRLLQWLTALWPAWEVAPSIAAFGLRQASPLVVLWLAIGALVAWRCRQSSIRWPGLGALAATAYLTTGALAAGVIGPLISRPASVWILQPESRSRVPLLDTFDAVARSHAIIYNPLRFAPAAGIPPLMTLTASPGERPAGQPVRVLLNARYGLPAGQYEVEIGGAPGRTPIRGTVGLQVGRIGSPLQEWEVNLAPGATWRSTFTLPVDAEFVGFVTTPPLDTATSLRLRPLRIVDKSLREANVHRRSFTILSAMAFPSASMFFHDEEVYPEPTGAWIRGESTASMTVAPAQPENGVTLRVHCGPTPNAVTFETTTWGERVVLIPGQAREVHIPAPPKPSPFLLRATTESSFVPAEAIPGSTDRRVLGCWMEIAD